MDTILVLKVSIESFVFWPLIVSFSSFLLAFCATASKTGALPKDASRSCLYNVEELYNVDQNGRLDFETGNAQSFSNDKSTRSSNLKIDLQHL